ncbi:MAG: DUF4288 domain-containing protein [Bacteroidia bacterium]|nr:DUF4288 domain-containing protein [Bacteroidia bacterium]
MNWYVVKIVFEVINKSNTVQFDEQIRLINAGSYNEAHNKTIETALNEESEFLDYSNCKVFWKFRAISYITKIDELQSGIELCSQIVEKTPEENYHYILELKHKEIIRKISSN